MASEMGDDNFAHTISTLLKLGNTVNALSLFTDNKNFHEIYNNAWDLVPEVSHYLTEDNENNNIEVYKCCENIINIIADQSKPEEVLLQFIEEIEAANDDSKFLVLLKPIQKVFFRVPQKRITSLGWCFNAIKTYLKKLETPDDYNLSEEERLLLDSDENVIRIVNLYTELDWFCESFITELLSQQQQQNNTSNCNERKMVIAKFLIEILAEPLCFLNLECFRGTKPEARTLTETFMKNTSKVITDPFCYLEMRNEAKFAELFKPNDFALGIYYNLLFTQEMPFVRVYDSVYVLYNMYRFIVPLLTHEKQNVIEKGISLSEALLMHTAHNSLPYFMLDNEHQVKFCQSLCSVIVYNTLENVRKKGLKVLQHYLWSFEAQGRYNLIWNLIRNVTHSGLKGFIITQYKEMFAIELKKTVGPQMSTYYSGRKLFDLFDEFTFLKEKEESDLVDKSDEIVSTLNLFIFIMLADKEAKSLHCWWIRFQDETYFYYLRRGIELSREHYQLQIKHTLQEKEDSKNSRNVSVSLTGGENLLEMPNEKKIEIMNLSLTTLDVIMSLLNYCERLIDENTCCAAAYARKNSTKSASSSSSASYEDDVKNKILEASLPFVVEMGWSKQALGAGAQSAGYPGVAHGLFPKGGADLVHYFQKSSNMKLVEVLKELEREQSGKSAVAPGEFVEKALKSRLEMIVPYLSRWPQAIAIMALPPNVPCALATLLTAVDDICYYAGDRSVDFNWYARRLGVAGVYKATELYLIQDKSPQHEATWQFLNRRLLEAVQIHEVLCKSDIASSGPKEAVTSAFVTARNILGLNWSR